jgi:subtilisin family serine protease
VVGSYDAHKAGTPLSWFSSAGPTRDGREKPEISAPGQDVLAAHSGTRTGVVRKSGTSMAAPMVTGALAVMLAEAHRQGRQLVSEALRPTLVGAARPPAGASGWDARYGRGRLSLDRLLQALPRESLVAEATPQQRQRRKPRRAT